VANQRHKAYGAILSGNGTMPTDRGFTGQIRDGSDARTNWEFNFFHSRCYNLAIGAFVQPDTIVPNPKDPQVLHRYAYALNNPLRLVDPSGHDPMDPGWVANYEAAHDGRAPTEQDWEDRQFSLANPGTGSGGAWTGADWETYSQVRGILGPRLLSEIGKGHSPGIWEELASADLVLNAHKPVEDITAVAGPDGTEIYVGGTVPGKADAWTWGNMIIINQGYVQSHSANDLRALIAHEYTHVLQYRALGFTFVPDYVWSGIGAVKSGRGFGSSANAFEMPAYEIQHIYEANPWLPAPWDFPD